MATGVMLPPSERIRVICPEVVTRRNVYTVTFSCMKYEQAMRGRIVAEHLQQDRTEPTKHIPEAMYNGSAVCLAVIGQLQAEGPTKQHQVGFVSGQQ